MDFDEEEERKRKKKEKEEERKRRNWENKKKAKAMAAQQQAAPTPASPASGEDPVIKPVKTDKEGRTKSIDMLYRSFVKVAKGVETEHVIEYQPPPPGEDLHPSLPPTEMTKDKGERQNPGQPNNEQRLLQQLLQAPPPPPHPTEMEGAMKNMQKYSVDWRPVRHLEDPCFLPKPIWF